MCIHRPLLSLCTKILIKKMHCSKAVHRLQQRLARLRVWHHKVKLSEARGFVAGGTCKIQGGGGILKVKIKCYVFNRLIQTFYNSHKSQEHLLSLIGEPQWMNRCPFAEARGEKPWRLFFFLPKKEKLHLGCHILAMRAERLIVKNTLSSGSCRGSLSNSRSGDTLMEL